MPEPILCHECGHDIDEHRAAKNYLERASRL